MLKPWPLNVRTHACFMRLSFSVRDLRGTSTLHWDLATHIMVLRASPGNLLDILRPRPQPRGIDSEPAFSQDSR